MNLNKLNPKKALNKAFLKVKPNRNDIENFKTQLIGLLDRINETESEEFHKNLVADFLKKTYYDPNHFINTKGRNDLVIHNGKDAKSTVGVIIEAKKPTNKAEMLKQDNINVKAFQELVLYYLRERITSKNVEVKYVIATNINEWFIFDANLFEKAFAQNKRLVQHFTDFEAGRLAGKTTDFFYKEIAESAIASLTTDITYTYFDIREYEPALRNTNKADDATLIALFKLLAPEHLLKLPFANDSNSLDKSFYTELLHIIGLAETKAGSKKLIERKKAGERQAGALLENAIIQLDSLDKIPGLEHPGQFGETHQERLFNVGLELAITWVNRILFLKLLEAQLITYHKGDPSYAFLKLDKVKNFHDLNRLFFEVLAHKPEERSDDVKQAFAKVPYLNSSLFDKTKLEDKTVFISNLNADQKLPILSATVLKDDKGKKRTGELNTLAYLFEFLDAYDFASEGAEDIQEENKSLINASVLGLIFEKINGYKDGSFFTPGFITMYMCRETIRRAVVQKFNERKGWTCKDLDDLYDNIEDRQEANDMINSLKICDPAVGSGHFLVSALNEMIAVKSTLKILQDREGRRLKEYQVEVVNDELIVTDENGELFEYNPTNPESQRIQETLFHEKQTIIEHCLFGVDINPNSVKICRLRLWIELLKNAYYLPSTSPHPSPIGEGAEGGVEGARLETLPNIDINIKCGNSLISRFALDADLKLVLKKQRRSIETYKNAVQTYREAKSKAEKQEMKSLIADIKSDFRTEIGNNDPKVKRLSKLRGELYTLLNQQVLFAESAKEQKARKQQQDKLEAEIIKLSAEIEDIKHNKIYENAFEWRFEFPEALNDDGDFVGFDLVIGNPPYGVNFNKKTGKPYETQYQTFNWRGESYLLFIEKGISVLTSNSNFAFIVPDTLLNLGFTDAARKFILQNAILLEVDVLPSKVFADATVDTILLFFQKVKTRTPYHENDVRINIFNKKAFIENLNLPERKFNVSTAQWYQQGAFNVQSNYKELAIIQKIDSEYPTLEQFAEMFSGIKAYEVGKGNSPQTAKIRDEKPFTSITRKGNNWQPFFDGKHIGHYSLLWKEDNWIDYGPWLAAPREQEHFSDEKILIRKITGKTLIAQYIPYTSYCNTLLFVLKLKKGVAKISYKALLGIINSTFIGWYFRKKFQISDDDTFPQIMIRDILQFSIPNHSNAQTNSIEGIVTQILTAKQQDLQADTTALEKEIDQLVYVLYGLTDEEIQIVETRSSPHASRCAPGVGVQGVDRDKRAE